MTAGEQCNNGNSVNKDVANIDIIHQNVQSMGNSVDSVNNMLKNNPNCKIVCITEHWKTQEELKCLAIENFNLGSAYYREHKQHGGSAIYVHKSVKFKPRKKLSQISIKNVFECAALECELNKTGVLILSIYRPPTGNTELFLSCIEKILSDIFKENKLIVVAGDFNIELLISNGDRTNFLSLMSSFNLKQTIFENTRITPNSESCVDNIFVNCRYLDTIVINTHKSDHTAQKIILQLQEPPENKAGYKRSFSQQNKDILINMLKDQNWMEVYAAEGCDVNVQWCAFMNTFINIFKHCFPLKLINLNKNRDAKIDWMSY